MTKIDQIKTEIERRIQHAKDNPQRYPDATSSIWSLQGILSFIESLEKDPDVNLEKELEKATEHWSIEPEYGALCNDRKKSVVDMDDVMSVARHFYELGLNARKEE